MLPKKKADPKNNCPKHEEAIASLKERLAKQTGLVEELQKEAKLQRARQESPRLKYLLNREAKRHKALIDAKALVATAEAKSKSDMERIACLEKELATAKGTQGASLVIPGLRETGATLIQKNFQLTRDALAASGKIKSLELELADAKRAIDEALSLVERVVHS